MRVKSVWFRVHAWTDEATPAAPRLSSGSPGVGIQGVGFRISGILQARTMTGVCLSNPGSVTGDCLSNGCVYAHGGPIHDAPTVGSYGVAVSYERGCQQYTLNTGQHAAPRLSSGSPKCIQGVEFKISWIRVLLLYSRYRSYKVLEP